MLTRQLSFLFVSMAIVLGGSAIANDQASSKGTNHDQPHKHQMTHGHQHGANEHSGQKMPTMAGQYAFATLAEIVALLEADPDTDWSKVDIESLRQHLIDMDRVTLSSMVVSSPVETGMRFTVTGDDAHTIASIQRMTQAHAAVQSSAVDHDVARHNASAAWHYAVELIENGSVMSVTTNDENDVQRIRALGFIGTMVRGMHHQAHHWSMATGVNPHNH